MTDLTGRVALVTGGSRGLGLAMVEAFAERGADVVVASRKGEACERVAERIATEYGRRALPVACNVSDWDQCDALVEQAYSTFGKLDVLVNDAGLSPRYETLSGVSRELFDKVMGVNLAGPFRLCALIGPQMAKDGGGAILNISSMVAIRPTPDVLPYAAAKAGLNVLTEGLSKSFGPTVRVNAIQAGPFLTDISRAWDMEAFKRTAKETMSLQRGGRPEEIVGAALYFCSDASSFCTGAVLRLDGGLH